MIKWDDKNIGRKQAKQLIREKTLLDKAVFIPNNKRDEQAGYFHDDVKEANKKFIEWLHTHPYNIKVDSDDVGKTVFQVKAEQI